MRRQKIYKISCWCSRQDSQFFFIYYQPAYDIRSAYRLMKERIRDYFGFKFVQFVEWTRVDKVDINHKKIY